MGRVVTKGKRSRPSRASCLIVMRPSDPCRDLDVPDVDTDDNPNMSPFHVQLRPTYRKRTLASSPLFASENSNHHIKTHSLLRFVYSDTLRALYAGAKYSRARHVQQNPARHRTKTFHKSCMNGVCKTLVVHIHTRIPRIDTPVYYSNTCKQGGETDSGFSLLNTFTRILIKSTLLPDYAHTESRR